MAELVLALVLMILLGMAGFMGYSIAKDEECHAVCKRENELRDEFCNIAEKCGNKGIYAMPCLSECVCR